MFSKHPYFSQKLTIGLLINWRFKRCIFPFLPPKTTSQWYKGTKRHNNQWQENGKGDSNENLKTIKKADVKVVTDLSDS